MIKPHTQFMYWSADEVAECLSGIPEALYRRLWEITQEPPNTPGLDYREVNDSFNHCLGHTGWHLLTEDEQRLLNGLADEIDKEHSVG